jgi:ComF family protein
MLKDFLNLIYPENCLACDDNLMENEKTICTTCLINLPKTFDYDDSNNALATLFAGRIALEHCSSFLFFSKKGIVQHLIHQLKYNNKSEIGIFMGKLHGYLLSKTKWAANIARILPVPLHPDRQKARGYNQSEMIAQGLSSVLGIEIDNFSLYRNTYTETQTHKDREHRNENVKNVFSIKDPKELEGKNILLVDDVVTTGATINGCCNALKEVKNLKISLACLAIPK